MDHPIPNAAKSIPGMLDTQRLAIDDYWQKIRRAILMAIGVHALFGVAGLIMHSPALAWLQVVSILVYAVSYALSYRRAHGIMTALTYLDLLGHSTMAAWIAGPDSGFQFYSWILLALVFTNLYRTIRAKTFIAIGLTISYVVIDWALHQITPLGNLSAQAIAALRYFNISCFLLAISMAAMWYTQQVNSAEARLRIAAGTDTLTGLLNRRRMSDRMQEQLRRARKRNRPLAVMLLDIDHFKIINDQHGHGRGDYVIACIGGILRKGVRQQDIVARWGGEEFMILMPDASLADAVEIAERIRLMIFSQVQRSDKTCVPVSVTIGVATWFREESLEATIHRADLALYQGKRNGRNRVMVEQIDRPDHRAAG